MELLQLRATADNEVLDPAIRNEAAQKLKHLGPKVRRDINTSLRLKTGSSTRRHPSTAAQINMRILDELQRIRRTQEEIVNQLRLMVSASRVVFRPGVQRN